MKKLSVIVLVYNKLKGATIPFLESLYSSGQDYELIIIDNGSTDGTSEYLKKFEQVHDNVKVIYNDENLGYSKGCNQGAKYASGEYIAFLNNDIILLPDWQNELFKIFNNEPDAGLVSAFSIESAEYPQVFFLKAVKNKSKKVKVDYSPVIRPNFSCVMTKKIFLIKSAGLMRRFLRHILKIMIFPGGIFLQDIKILYQTGHIYITKAH